ncbi:substrate-binding periplasmic protein [Arenibaculum pallidiluteum]|uniref:substrate-binding periplasmic protein n=1 Tax=Arenibaculum pallidiluteum TaxID=2812559 RepID=UPI001A96526A|nr:transporter substrate-binding domain-containing protein [Arenibaculum pallidiluteum]
MNKVILAAFASLLALGSVAASAAPKLVIAYEDKQQFPNYLGNSTDIDANKPGMHVELVKMAAADIGADLQLVRLPWKRALDSLKKGEVDAVFSGSFSKDRLELGVYPMKGDEPDDDLRIGTTSYSLYRAKGSPVSWDGKAFSGLKGAVNAPAGYSIVGDLKKMEVSVNESASTTQDLTMLKAGRIDAVAAQEVTADELLKKPELATLEKVTPPIVTKSYFVIFSHQRMASDPELVKKFWASLARNRTAKGAELAAKYVE